MKIGSLTFDPLPSHPGWLVAAPTGDAEALEALARRLNVAGAAPGYDAVCAVFDDDDASIYRLYLIPHGNPGDILRAFEIGTHGGAYSLEDPEEVCAEVEAIHAHSPIVPFFADAAGFKFGFRQAITPELLDFLEEHVTMGLEAMMEGDDGSIRSFIEREKHVHLWWD